jgi:hypothetical protein
MQLLEGLIPAVEVVVVLTQEMDLLAAPASSSSRSTNKDYGN